MPKFDIKKIDAVKGAQVFYQLTIDDNPDFSGANSEDQRDARKLGVLDIYEKELEVKYRKDIRMIYAYMDLVANNQTVSPAKYHELAGRAKNDLIKDFEFKHGDLRIYGFKIPDGKVIAYCGYKNQQKSDIKKFRSLKNQCYQTLNFSK